MSKKEESKSTSGFSTLKSSMSNLAETRLLERFLEGNQKKDDIEIGEIMRYRFLSDLMQDNSKQKKSQEAGEIEKLRRQVEELQKEKEQNQIVSEIQNLQKSIKKEKKPIPISGKGKSGGVSEGDLKELKSDIKDLIDDRVKSQKPKERDWGSIAQAIATGVGALPQLISGLRSEGYNLNDLVEAVGQISQISAMQTQQKQQSSGEDFIGKILDNFLGGKKEQGALAGTGTTKESGISASGMLQQISQAVRDKEDPQATAGLILNALGTLNLWGEGQQSELQKFANPSNVRNWIEKITGDNEYAEAVGNEMNELNRHTQAQYAQRQGGQEG